PDRQVISMDYPSKFNNYHYAFYLGAVNDDDPAMFLGQPVYANLYVVTVILCLWLPSYHCWLASLYIKEERVFSRSSIFPT
ncbi:PepSY-associated TM helix superfamily, partial [human gut metagenome]